MSEKRAEKITDRDGDWTLVITDDMPLTGQLDVAQARRCEVFYQGHLVDQFAYPSYRVYTLLAHWKEWYS